MSNKQQREQLDRMAEAVTEKNEQAEERSRQAPTAGPPPEPAGTDQDPEPSDPREKSSRHGQVTADKWNQ